MNEDIAGGADKICLEKGSHYCINLDGEGNPVSASLSKSDVISIPEFSKKVDALEKQPFYKKTIEKANAHGKGIQDRIDTLAAELEEMAEEKTKKTATSGTLGHSGQSGKDYLATANGASSFASVDSGATKRRDSFKDLLSQFRSKKKNNKLLEDQKTVNLAGEEIGISQDNIFAMVHRRYQKHQKEKEFIEISTRTTATQGIYLPL